MVATLYAFTSGGTGHTGPAGPTGGTGPTGPAGSGTGGGSVWLTGAGVPNDADGNDGDLYLNTTTGDIYEKVAGSWF
jgi:hypothetical protein